MLRDPRNDWPTEEFYWGFPVHIRTLETKMLVLLKVTNADTVTVCSWGQWLFKIDRCGKQLYLLTRNIALCFSRTECYH